MANPNPPPIDPDAAAAGAAKGRETQRKNREQQRQDLEDELQRKNALAAAVSALVEVAANPEESAARVSAAKEIIHQLVGRPAQVVQGDAKQPIRIVVESVARREAAEE